jgi:hypothetical protein
MKSPDENLPARLRRPCRLFVILAKEAPSGVIIRRGPSKWFQIIKWNTDNDTFEPGQWFHGRIDEQRCDLSPDGTKLVYMATRYAHVDESIGYGWIAISKIPYLTALALFPVLTCAGGLFISDNEVWLNYDPKLGTNTLPPPSSRCPDDLKVTAYRINEEQLKLLLKHHGWANQEKLHPTQPFAICLNSLNILEGNSFVLKDKNTNMKIPISGAVWADWDHAGRLVYAKEGKLFEGNLREAGQIHSTELADFNAHKPEPKETPNWAKEW